MERNTVPVKSRQYDSTRRQQQARQTREAILDAAWGGFVRDGFAATTIAAVAADARVSVDTIYKTFGGKPGLVKALYERGLAGEGPVHAETRSDALQTTEEDPLEIMRGIGRLITEVAPRGAPIALLISDAAVTDPDMAQLEAELEEERLRRMTHNARNLADAGHLQEGLSVEHAGLIMWSLTSPQLYRLLIDRKGWSVEEFADFMIAALTAALLPVQTPKERRRRQRASTTSRKR